jgi:hypothetical protein
VHLDDEGAAGAVVGVAVDLHDAERRLLHVELEGLEDQVGAQPHVLAASGLERRAEHVGVGGAHGRPGPVGGQHEVVLAAQLLGVRRLGPEEHRDAEVGAAALEDAEQLLAAHRREAVPAGRRRRPPVVHVDVVPAGEVPLHLGEHLWIGVLDPAERLVGEDDAEPEGVVRSVALPDGHLVARVELLDERGEVEASRASADDGDAHGSGYAACATVVNVAIEKRARDREMLAPPSS